MLKSCLEIDFRVVQKRYAAIFEILIFQDFSLDQSPKFCENDEKLSFDPLRNREKSKFQKLPHNVFVSPQNPSPNQISASTDL